MDAVIQCFGDIVGTTPDKNTDSGLYITDLEAVETIHALIEDQPTELDLAADLELKLLSARRIAILNLNADLTTLMQKYSKPRAGYSGLLGSKKFSGVLDEDGKSGIRIVCRKIQDAELVLKGVNTIFSEAGNMSVFIASNYSDDITEIQNIETVKNKLKINDLPAEITLPLYHENAEGCVEYYIYHENTLTPNNNKLHCSSCRKFKFDASRPTWRAYGSEQYINIAGFNGEPDELSEKGSNNTKGLQLKVDIICRTDRAICRDNVDFRMNPLAMAYASAIQYKAGSVIIWDLTRSPKLNRIIMSDMETFREAAKHYERKYNDMIRFISKNMEVTSDCFCEHGFITPRVTHP